MAYESGEVIVTGVMIVTVILVLIFTIRMLVRGKRSMTCVYFAFAIVSMLLSEFYWLTYDILRGDARMPFAANEFAEMAMFLLLASSLRTVFTERIRIDAAFVLTFLYALGNVFLWVIWNGDWVEALLTAPAYIYYLVTVVFALCRSHALRRGELVMIACLAFSSLLLQYAEYLFPSAHNVLGLSNYILLFTSLGVWAFLLIRAFSAGKEPHILLALTFCTAAWAQNTMYMCAEWWYLVAECLYVFTVPAMFFAVRREVAE